jgi:formamidopyrimidine-DNA glycosylase
MPELPGLVHLEKRLPPLLTGQRIVGVEIKEPVVIRMLLPGDFTAALLGAEFASVRRHGPFLVFALSKPRELVIHPMLAGRLQWAALEAKIPASCALVLECEGPARQRLLYLDDKKMGKKHFAITSMKSKSPSCIVDVMRWGIAEVEKANPPLEVKARGHMRVRHRQDQPCPRCGAKIRRAGVRGFDAFFCPACQPLQREQFIDWRKLNQPPHESFI